MSSRKELEGRLKRAVIDASALMAALLPNEPLKERAKGHLEEEELELLAPSLEVANSLLKAERREGRGKLGGD